MTVLTDASIKERFDSIFPSGGEEQNIRAAKYYLTLGEDLLFLPGGVNYPQGTKRRSAFTLEPGQSAMVSTKDRLSMPGDLLGIIGSRFENSERGLLFFGGMVVDPGYGHPKDGSSEVVGEPLFITVANVSDRPIELRPGQDPIASLAFFRLDEEIDSTRLHRYPIPTPARDREAETLGGKMPHSARPLGFVEDLEDVRLKLDKVRASTEQVVLFGVIVLAVTLCAAIVGAIFSADPHFKTGESLGHSLGLTLGVVFAAVGVATGTFYIWIWMRVEKKRINRLPD